ncbi:MAG: DoxX family membrane protein [Bacteroidia bacterium]|nr:DoxX family membrane protein [Bacteroidia bacterium]
MKTIRTICRIIVGLIFTFSGFVKVIDPLGTTYKFDDYFRDSFATPELLVLSFPFAIIMCALELILGLSLLLNLKPRISSWLALVFMLFFTPLTLYIALVPHMKSWFPQTFDAVKELHDCGCFGDAFVMTNWQTFYKNLIIIIPVIILFITRKKTQTWLTKGPEYCMLGILVLLSLGLEYYNYQHLPVFDFRPYHIGASIPGGMIIPEEQKNNVDVYEVVCYYKNTETGERKAFTLKNLPSKPWIWKSTENKLVHRGYQPPIHDFSIASDAEGDITQMVLNDTNYSFLFIAYDLRKSNLDGFAQAYNIAEFADKYNYKFYCMTASVAEDIQYLKDTLIKIKKINLKPPQSKTIYEKVHLYEKEGQVIELPADSLPPANESWNFVGEDSTAVESDITDDGFAIKFYKTDDTTLKTIIRANPGLVLLKKGVIINHWHYNDFPEIDELEISLKKVY